MKRTLIIALRQGDSAALARLLVAEGKLHDSDIDLAANASLAITKFRSDQYGAVVLTYDTNAGGQLGILSMQVKGLRSNFPGARLIVRGPYDFSRELGADWFVSTRDDHAIVHHLVQVLAKTKDDEPPAAA
jgi:hypothetical protein